MASNSELKNHPRGQIGFGAGDLQSATLGKFTVTNNGKLKHTLKLSPSGFVKGNTECSGTIEMDISEDGLERDVFDLVESGTEVPFRFKMPGLSKTIAGKAVSVDSDFPTDDAVHIVFSFVGKLVKS